MSNKKCVNAVCVLTGKRDKKGVVLFHQCDNDSKNVLVDISFENMTPNKKFAIHIHTYGDLRHGCKSLGDHWNPENVTHGSRLFPDYPRHAGDLINNIVTDKDGKFHYRYRDPLLRLIGKKSIIGRSVVIHEGEDDLGQGNNKESLINGNAGARIMCGVIGYAEN